MVRNKKVCLFSIAKVLQKCGNNKEWWNNTTNFTVQHLNTGRQWRGEDQSKTTTILKFRSVYYVQDGWLVISFNFSAEGKITFVLQE